MQKGAEKNPAGRQHGQPSVMLVRCIRGHLFRLSKSEY
jgi:hypothetical protein